MWISPPTQAAKRSSRLKPARPPKVQPGFWANPLLTTTAPKQRPNVLIYMIDTLRADHASLYGYARDTTPYLKKLGATRWPSKIARCKPPGPSRLWRR